MYQFKQIIDLYEDESHNLSGFIASYKNRTIEELETIISEFQSLYTFRDDEGDRGDLISPDDWFAFYHWEPCDQTDFLAYLAIKIAVARS
jgi:hypothetical protein